MARRRAALASAAMGGLGGLWGRRRGGSGAGGPDFDPDDGGVAARVLLLLERPGRAVGERGFVSRDNATPTARNIRRFCDEAGLARCSTVIWNVVPWLDDAARNRTPRPGEIEAGSRWLPPLLELLTRLEVVVLAGRVAGSAAATVRACRPDARLRTMPHPSPTIVCTHPRFRAQIVACLAETASMLLETSCGARQLR